jgi:hypothetical protein
LIDEKHSFPLAVSSLLRYVAHPLALAAATLFLSSTVAFGQVGYFSKWFRRVHKTQSDQPHWITRVATTPRKAHRFIVAVVFLLSSSLTFPHDGFSADLFNMVSETQAEQHYWIIPLNTTTPRPEQEFRNDIQWQTHKSCLTALTHQDCY